MIKEFILNVIELYYYLAVFNLFKFKFTKYDCSQFACCLNNHFNNHLY